MGKREELIEAIEDVLWASRDGTRHQTATAALDAILAGLKMPSEEMLRAGAVMTDDGEHGRERAKGVLWACLSTLEETKP